MFVKIINGLVCENLVVGVRTLFLFLWDMMAIQVFLDHWFNLFSVSRNNIKGLIIGYASMQVVKVSLTVNNGVLFQIPPRCIVYSNVSPAEVFSEK